MKKITLNVNIDKLIKFSYVIIAVFAMSYFFGKDIAKKNRTSLHSLKCEKHN